MQRLTPLNVSPHSSLPSSPLLAATPHTPLPLLTPLNMSELQVPQRRLLIPTVRPSRLAPPRLQRTRTGRITRPTRSGSLGAELSATRECRDWVSSLGRMNVVEEQVEVRGFQIYAVEKWVVERGRLVNVVSVYTGDSRHKITVTVLSPFSSLPDAQAQAEFDNAVHVLRRDGARPRETEHGVILVTSLANFRSDYNLVLIPDGNFMGAREQLYVNINLLRMGCSGRSALTLEEPSEPTKDRYLSMYCFSESVLQGLTFNYTVLELVKLVQCALALFGMFDASPEERNGLLCDLTVDGIQRWTDQIGEPVLLLEPMERVGDPSVVSALLSLVVTMRNKLHAIGCTQAPKDPFYDPTGFMQAVAALHSQKSPAHVGSGCLTLDTVVSINAAFNRRAPEYRVPRIILNKLDGITTDLNLRTAGERDRDPIYTTADLAGFVHMIIGASSKDAVESLKALWTGRLPRRKKSRGDDEERERTDGRSTEDEDGMASIFPNWGKHMKIDSLKGGRFDFGLGRSKKPSVDLSAAHTKVKTNKSLSADEAAPTGLSFPAHLVSGDSGAEGSPQSTYPSSFGLSPAPSARSSNVNLLSPEEARTGHRPTLPLRQQSTLSTVSDPLTSSREERRAFLRRASAYEPQTNEADEDEELENERRVNRGLLLGATQRRHSMADLQSVRDRPRLSVDRMKIDVGLCGQYLIIQRREQHLQNMIALLERLRSHLAAKNAHLREEIAANEGPLAEATRLRREIWTALDAAEARCVDWSSIQEMLVYQSEQMYMKNLWRSVRQQRMRVLAARQTVFGASPGTRPRPGTANRRFFRVQSTLDPCEQRLVDWRGRTESEAEEEAEIPEENGPVGPPPYEELTAYAEATRIEKQPSRWWWPFSRSTSGGKGSDDETTLTAASVTAQGNEEAVANIPAQSDTLD